MLFLSLPSKKYKNSFISYVKELEIHGEIKADDLKKILSQNIDDYIVKLKNNHSLKKLAPEIQYWLINNKDIVGTVNIRPVPTKELREKDGHIGYHIRPSMRKKRFGTKALELALKQAKKLKLNSLLITCDETNIPSQKIIKSNGGVYKDTIPAHRKNSKTLRFVVQN